MTMDMRCYSNRNHYMYSKEITKLCKATGISRMDFGTLNSQCTTIYRLLDFNVIIPKWTTKSDLIHSFHGACFSPPKWILLQAIKNGNFISWPGFTYEATSRYLQTTAATVLGHMHQERKNLQSTKHDKDL